MLTEIDPHNLRGPMYYLLQSICIFRRLRILSRCSKADSDVSLVYPHF